MVMDLWVVLNAKKFLDWLSETDTHSEGQEN